MHEFCTWSRVHHSTGTKVKITRQVGSRGQALRLRCRRFRSKRHRWVPEHFRGGRAGPEKKR
ncbi:hypothetical protein BC938DRAFT_479264 [Jimgerdemannia flammicorona]|uniref:Uncharacterized protein n=1 Tax=Jimgerdemannia flammicorona TaxID=994334 RepID=A0A433QL71_9FUNG|nr:hypothetical protein BC938DRAFT_479264 [Jimgerdemannia flammicorona]